MKSDYIKSVLNKKVSDDPVMRDFLETIYAMDPRANLRYKTPYNSAIDDALKKEEENGNV